ncbi:MAG: chloride channel protein [Lentisphaerae bacterium]|nr:chloride channel protein [Lentisphaerota bacterium]
MTGFVRVGQGIARRFRRPDEVRSVLLTVVCSLAAALAAVGFMGAMNGCFSVLYLRAAGLGVWRFAVISLVSISVSSLIVGWLLTQYGRGAAGSGVPQLKSAFWLQFGEIAWRPVWVKAVAGIASIGGGASLGREGPSVFIGGGVASLLAGAFGISRRQRRAAVATGAAAALAAAFNTPLAAIAFVLEEVIHDFSSRLIGRIMLAAVIGALVVHALLGPQPSFELPPVAEPPLRIYVAVLVVALAATLVAVAFQRSVLGLRRYMRGTRVPPMLQPWIGGLITWALGLGVFAFTGRVGVFGLGYHDLSSAFTAGMSAPVAGLLLLTKLMATVACYGCGGCGGIFSPTLFLGAMTGLSVGGLFSLGAPLSGEDHVLLAAVGMCACFGATVRAPWSAMLMVFEMTHAFAVVPALMLGTLVSQGVVRLFGHANFYDAILEQDGHPVHEVAPPRTLFDWQQAAVVTVANPNPVILHDLAPAAIEAVLLAHPYRVFPVQQGDGRFAVVERRELEAAVREGRAPRLRKLALALGHQPIREVSDLFIESDLGMVLVLGHAAGAPIGLLTLHDLLRAQAALQE